MKPFRLVQSSVILFLIFFSLTSWGQKKFTVVCDKSDNTVKVVDSEIRSPNYVPIKGGFPFRQVAQKWIDENYTTTDCNPTDIIKQNQPATRKKQPPVSKNQLPQNNVTSMGPAPRSAPVKNTPQNNNTSIYGHLKFSDLGKAFYLESNIAPGVGLGIEQLIGTSMYLGFGLATDFYFLDLASTYDDLESELMVMGKIPVFLGYRSLSGKTLLMTEFGVAANTAMTALSGEMNIPHRTFDSSSFNLLARIKLGNEYFLFELGSEYWLTSLFEDYDFNMRSVYLGIRLYF